MKILKPVFAILIAVGVSSFGVANADVHNRVQRAPARTHFVHDRGYVGPHRVPMGATNNRAPAGYAPRGPAPHTPTTFRNYLDAKARGIYDPGYRNWLNGDGVVRR